jgi:thiamine pyrophosphate-dependent acetolactate synthase large subunit-like protein
VTSQPIQRPTEAQHEALRRAVRRLNTAPRPVTHAGQHLARAAAENA